MTITWPDPRHHRAPRARKRSSPERSIQVAVVKAVRKLNPAAVYHSVPNGGFRVHMHAVMKLKAEGLIPGVPDLLFLLPPNGRAAYLELKAGKGRLSTQQKDFAERAESAGCLWACAHSLDEAMAVLGGWGVVPVSTEAMQ